eukprot:TRINITY_DN4278_c0_g1::TRINITY_DN4278_c0_g1_i1::g.8027::m.8027 TRINITY_DN4278_c0_g1::TRINITY_DN4278_c0_g1_i1::g.8027  ORF type:complete len:481 (-),score=152.30,sp/Q1JQC1/MFSD1_BOVIN/31.66/2e-55,MFS_1/PF07690.11/3.3e-28,Sugar_tr/PF00083.19/4.2e-11,ATG22/PF11700.3/3.2,ATG22/PF11700.3/1.3e-05,MFS_2/PF13347.1/0.015,MFS_2/PF13347.1/0.00065,LacY_symp/PF01306.14/4.3e+03,LacY_symp/PF01306.14/0.0037,LacY_symp/PF01306.14/0.26,LacY_symp/PF01306.14/0.0054,MFS_1_like/PF12832.2/9.4e+03,MFS_1_like/PF12832.2/4.
MGALDPESTSFRFLILFFAAFLIFGNYFVMDQPGSLQPEWVPDDDEDEDCDDEKWKDEGICLNYTEFSLLYSVYYFPNIALAMFGGVLCDRLGFRKSSFLFSTVILIGQIIVAIGAQAENFMVMLAGRFVYAWGGEGCAVAQNVIVSKYFQGKELALALGIALAIGRCGSGLNFMVTTPIADAKDPAFALWIGVIACTVSLFCSVCLNILDLKGDTHADHKRDIETSQPLIGKEAEPEAPTEGIVDTIKSFSYQFWLGVGIVMAFYGGIFPFNGNAVDILDKLWEVEDANYIVSIPLFLAVILAPIFGKMVDHIGHRPLLTVVSCALVFTAHLLFGVVKPEHVPDSMHTAMPIIFVIIYGVGYTLFVSSFYPCVPMIVRDKRALGTAFGVIFSLQNLGLIIVTQVVGVIRDKMDDQTAELLFAGCEVVAFLLSVQFFYLDQRQGGQLSSTHHDAPEDKQLPSVLDHDDYKPLSDQYEQYD